MKTTQVPLLIVLGLLAAMPLQSETFSTPKWEISAVAFPELSYVVPLPELSAHPYYGYVYFPQYTETGVPIFLDAGLQLGLGYSFPWGKIEGSVARTWYTYSVGIGYGKEWFFGRGFSLEAALFSKTILYFPFLSENYGGVPDMLYEGLEGTVRANFIAFDHLVVFLYSGLHARYLVDTAFLVGGPVGLGLALRF